jgi:hypothetical protein
LRISTTMLGLFPHPSRANSLGLAIPRRSGSLWSRRVGCRLPGPPRLWCWSIRLAGLAGRGTKARPPGLHVVGGQAGPAPARPAQIGGQVARCRGPPRARAQRGRRSRPGRSPGRGELFARVGGSSVSLTCSCADQGGRHVDMVVGADHRGRACVGVWRDAAARPLTALRQRRGHGRRSCWTRPTAWRRGRVQASGRSRPPALPGRRARGAQPGLGPVLLGHREQFVVGRPRRSASRSDVWCVFGLHAAVAPRTGEVLQGTWPAPPA